MLVSVSIAAINSGDPVPPETLLSVIWGVYP
jgi:hypothetical protein